MRVQGRRAHPETLLQSRAAVSLSRSRTGPKECTSGWLGTSLLAQPSYGLLFPDLACGPWRCRLLTREAVGPRAVASSGYWTVEVIVLFRYRNTAALAGSSADEVRQSCRSRGSGDASGPSAYRRRNAPSEARPHLATLVHRQRSSCIIVPNAARNRVDAPLDLRSAT